MAILISGSPNRYNIIIGKYIHNFFQVDKGVQKMSYILDIVIGILVGILMVMVAYKVCPLIYSLKWNNNKEVIQMKEVWEQRRQAKVNAIVSIQDMIEGNLEEINEAVCEFLDEVTGSEDLITELTNLRTTRDHLFAVKNALEHDVELYDELLATAVAEKD